MTPDILKAALAATLFATLALAGCRKEAPAPVAPTAIDPAPVPAPAPAAAVVVTGVDLGNAIGPDNRVTSPTTVFSTSDTIHASVATSAADPAVPAAGRLTARWTYQDGQVVDELSQDYSFTGTGNTAFQISNPGGWPTGSYKVEILLDGELVQTREFQVQ